MSNIILTQQRAKNKLVGCQYVNKCENMDCPIADACPYCGNVVQCKLHKDYIATIMENVQSMIDAGTLDKMQVSVICSGILPLYNHLFKFQLLEMGLDSPILYGKQITMHPVYKEIRATSKTIFDFWKNLGVIKSNVPMPDMPVMGQANANFVDVLTADTKVEETQAMAVKEQEEYPDTESEEEDDIPIVKVPMKKGELQKARMGIIGKGKRMFDVLEKAGEEVRNSVKVAGEDADGNPILVDADFDPTKLPEDDIQQSFVDSLGGGIPDEI